jgi:hypothetical protein
MPTHIHVNIGKPSPDRHGEHKARHHDDARELPGWSKPREPKNEPPAVNKNIRDVGRWTARAEKHSGPQFAPGIGKGKRG